MDITAIDREIHQNFDSEFKKLPQYITKLSNLKSIKNINCRAQSNLHKVIIDLENHIKELEDKTSYNFYIIDTAELLAKYQKILKSPMKMNFMGKSIKDDKEKLEVIEQYIRTASKYICIDVVQPDKNPKNDKVICDNCGNCKNFDIIEDNIYICCDCSAQKSIIRQTSSYGDNERVNISSKYMYDRKIHFRDCINQYQGKQNSTIHQKVYDDLIDQFEKHHMLIDNPDKKVKFSKITKGVVQMFLKDLGYTNHYENVHLIHYVLTGVNPDNISYIEDQLIDDFDTLTDLYDKLYKDINRKNFINTQHILYQLLMRHKHVCDRENFGILKTLDRRAFHDEICKSLFEELGWNYIPFY